MYIAESLVSHLRSTLMQRNDGRGHDLREMRLPEALNVSFPGRMRRIVSAIANRTFARRKTNREKSGKRPPRSALYQAARATERTLWTVKLAQRPKSFWYPYPTLGNVGVLEQLLASTGLDLVPAMSRSTWENRGYWSRGRRPRVFSGENRLLRRCNRFRIHEFQSNGGNPNLERRIELSRQNSLD